MGEKCEVRSAKCETRRLRDESPFRTLTLALAALAAAFAVNALAQPEPPHPILNISGSTSGVDNT